MTTVCGTPRLFPARSPGRERKRQAALEQARLDSIKNAEQSAELAAAAAEQARKDSIAEAKRLKDAAEQARQDSISAAREAEKLAMQAEKEADYKQGA